MKQLTCTLGLLMVVSFLTFASGTGSDDWAGDGWKTYPRLDGFGGVELRTNAELTLIPGTDWDVRARGNRKDIEDLDIYVLGRTLVIRRQSIFDFTGMSQRLEIEVTLPRLTELSSESSGNIRTDGRFESGDMKITLSGSGDAEIDAISNSLECRVTGSGDFGYRGRADTMELVMTGSGDADVNVTANVISVKITGSGDADFRGGADVLEVRINGSGRMMAKDLPVRTASVQISGSGDADVDVSRTLEAVTTGSGSVYYRGNPQSLDVRETGSGRVIGR